MPAPWSAGPRPRRAAGACAAAALTATAVCLSASPPGPAAATAPTAAIARPATATADPLFGANMSFYNANDSLATNADTQALFRSWGLPFIRVPLRAAFDGGATVTDAQLLTALKAVRTVGATPVLILRGPGGGRTTGAITATDTHLLDLVHQVFGDGTAYLEFGNEPDLAANPPVTADAYTAAWNAVIPTLKARYPSAGYKYVGPVTSRVDHSYVDYLATFVAGAVPKPDLLSWHEYVCDSKAAGWQDTCTGNLPHWQTHVTNVEDAVTAKLGHPLDYIVSEWNIDPNATGPVYTDGANAPYLAKWTTTALATLRALTPAPKATMIYTATDHGDFALVKGSTTLTAQGPAFHDAMTSSPPTTPPTTPPGAVTVGFEDGTTQGWSGYYGNAGPAVTTDLAYEGTHALHFTQNTNGHTAVGTTTNLTPGATITYHVHATQPTTVTPFTRDPNYTPTLTTPTTLTPNQWTTITWHTPTTTTTKAIGLDADPGTGTITIDALTWPTS
ncbi:hypothetical protein [Actinomadura gamaensis]|uniref:Uncharacterized protein n=1 Tax=Actinomadura gamaensis TaxID=1763541 RepID=A0ABV9TYU0_9ACTN